MGSVVLHNAQYQEFLHDVKCETVELLSEYLDDREDGEKGDCTYKKIKENIYLVKSLEFAYIPPGTLISEELSASATIMFPSINASVLVDGMNVVLVVRFVDGTEVTLCDFTDDFFGSTVNDFYTAIVNEINAGASGFTAVIDLGNGSFELTAPVGSYVNFGQVIMTIPAYFGVVDVTHQSSTDVLTGYGNSFGGNLAGYFFLYDMAAGTLRYVDQTRDVIDSHTFHSAPVSLSAFSSPVYSPTLDCVYIKKRDDFFNIYAVVRNSLGNFTVHSVPSPISIPDAASGTMAMHIYNPYNESTYLANSQFVMRIYPDSITSPTINNIATIGLLPSAAINRLSVNPYNGDVLLYDESSVNQVAILRDNNSLTLITSIGAAVYNRCCFIDGGSTANSYWLLTRLNGVCEVVRADDLTSYWSFTIPPGIDVLVPFYSNTLGKLLVSRISAQMVDVYDMDLASRTLSSVLTSIDLFEIIDPNIVQQGTEMFDIPELDMVAYQMTNVPSGNNAVVAYIGEAFSDPITLDGVLTGGDDEEFQEEGDNCYTQNQAEIVSHLINRE